MRSFVLWAALAALFARSEARSCYFPDGTPSGTDVPCTDDPVGDSFCCFTGQACLSNKVCGAFHTNSTGSFMTFARGTCTDSSWNSPACPKFCLDGESPRHSVRDRRCAPPPERLLQLRPGAASLTYAPPGRGP